MTLAADGLGTANILVVEDDPVASLMYGHVLDRPGWRAILTGTLASATAALRAQPVSLVVLDLFLPDGDGRSWLAELRALPEHATTPVIVIAGTVLMDAQVACYELGADTMIPKPVAPAVLVAAVSGALQRASARGRAPAPTPPPAPEPAKPRVRGVLLAEDDDVVAALVKHRLTREGFEVTRARDGIAAFEIAKTQPLNLAVLDVMMPGLDGFELLTRLRALPATARLPILMLTGLGGERDVERALALGADDYVLKPFSPVELTARVNRLLKLR